MSSVKKLKTGSEICKLVAQQRRECAASITEFLSSSKGSSFRNRVKNVGVNKRKDTEGAVLYWMWRDKRVQDNWALLHSQAEALKRGVPLHVAVCVPPSHGHMTLRHYSFMLEGLKEVEEELVQLGIGFHLLLGDPPSKLTPSFLASLQVGLLVADFSPLREHRSWLAALDKNLSNSCSIQQVDAHNVVPVWVTSEKQEYAARTIRPKITNKLPDYLTPFPPVISHPDAPEKKVAPADFAAAYASLNVDRDGLGVAPVDEHFAPGYQAGLANLEQFVSSRLKHYSTDRNDPTKFALSNMSPWVNHGQVSMQRAVLYVKAEGKSYSSSAAGFVEEAVVRRELSDNFCFYNPKYDSILGATDWAQKTLADHAKDTREYIYSREELEEGRTHDDLWNAAQLQLVQEGKMHGFLRMYWAKKILEWTQSPEQALEEAIRLNDRYALDGNDPNGYVGVMWSIAGIHDQGWGERKVFGKIRYMNYAGCKRKFDVNKFVLKYKAKVHTKSKKGGIQEYLKIGHKRPLDD